jgi:hypothetical protein
MTMSLIYDETTTTNNNPNSLAGFRTLCHYCGECIAWALRDQTCPACGEAHPSADDDAANIDEALAAVVDELERAA